MITMVMFGLVTWLQQ